LLDPKKLIFIDETWVKTTWSGYVAAPRSGQRLIDRTFTRPLETSTFVASLRSDGLVAPASSTAPSMVNLFLASAKQVLAPVLRAGNMVVVDSLSSHKVPGVRTAIEAAGAQLMFLPP
jgi:hypothetical protein